MRLLSLCKIHELLVMGVDFDKKIYPGWLPFKELRSYLQTVNRNKQWVFHNNQAESLLNKYHPFNRISYRVRFSLTWGYPETPATS